MNHEMGTEGSVSRVLNLTMSTLGKYSFILAAVHTAAINEGDTITWAGTYGETYKATVEDSEWWLFDDPDIYIAQCLVNLI